VSSFRTADQIANSGWWASLFTQERQAPAIRIEGAEEQDGEFVHHRQPVRGRQCHHHLPLGHQLARTRGLRTGSRWLIWAMVSA
jgi:hypothetical protein